MSNQEAEATLTVKDRLNFSYLLANQILTVQKAILNSELSDREVAEAINGLVHLIPDKWKDQEFKDEYRKSEIEVEEENRPTFCGVMASLEFCDRHKIEAKRKIKKRDHYPVFQACINLLNRKGMLSKINRVEELEGIDFDDHEVCESELPSE